MNVVDIVVIVFLIVSCTSGLRKGFFKSLFDTLGVIISFFISKEYYSIAQEYIMDNTRIYNTLNKYFTDKFTQYANKIPNGNFNPSNIFKGFEKLPAEIKNVSNHFFSVEAVTDNSSSLNSFASKISEIIVIIISFVLVMLLVYICLLILTSIIDKIFKVPGLNLLNRMFGGGLGILRGVIILYIIFAVASPFIAFSSDNNIVTDIILTSKSNVIFYENNIILSYLTYKGIL